MPRTAFAVESANPIAGNNAIPANRIDPVAAKILGYYPLPNAGGPGSPHKQLLDLVRPLPTRISDISDALTTMFQKITA